MLYNRIYKYYVNQAPVLFFVLSTAICQRYRACKKPIGDATKNNSKVSKADNNNNNNKFYYFKLISSS